MSRTVIVVVLAIASLAAGCGSDTDATSSVTSTPAAGRDLQPPAPAQQEESTAVPVRTTAAARRPIALNLETNGVLEAENEVEIVARVSGPIVAIEVEEGMEVRAGQLLARIDDREYANQVAISTVSRDDARRAFERTKASWQQGLVSQESYDASLSRLEAAEAQLEAKQIMLDYTRVSAPFGGVVSARHIKLAQHVGVGTPLFRLTDFNPLLCPIQVPEKDLSRVRVGQPAFIEVESFPDDRFSARVDRVRPTVEATTGTFTVTLEVAGRGLLRPGMFASVYLEVDSHPNALVIPASALVLDSIGDTVFVKQGDKAARREVRLGFREGEDVEVLDGVADGDKVIVLGQDGLADGTPVRELEEPGPVAEPAGMRLAAGGGQLSPEMEAEARRRMKERGLSDEEISQRLERMRQGGGRGAGAAAAGAGQPAAGATEPDEMPPQLLEFIRNADPEQLEFVKQRMRERGRTEEEIEQILRDIRGGKQ